MGRTVSNAWQGRGRATSFAWVTHVVAVTFFALAPNSALAGCPTRYNTHILSEQQMAAVLRRLVRLIDEVQACVQRGGDDALQELRDPVASLGNALKELRSSLNSELFQNKANDILASAAAAWVRDLLPLRLLLCKNLRAALQRTPCSQHRVVGVTGSASLLCRHVDRS